MNDELYTKCIDLIRDHDKKWIKRKRKIDTELIFKTLVSSAITDTGVSSCLGAFNSDCSHVAMNRARNKLDDNFFKDVNTTIREYSVHNRWFKNTCARKF